MKESLHSQALCVVVVVGGQGIFYLLVFLFGEGEVVQRQTVCWEAATKDWIIANTYQKQTFINS